MKNLKDFELKRQRSNEYEFVLSVHRYWRRIAWPFPDLNIQELLQHDAARLRLPPERARTLETVTIHELAKAIDQISLDILRHRIHKIIAVGNRPDAQRLPRKRSKQRKPKRSPK